MTTRDLFIQELKAKGKSDAEIKDLIEYADSCMSQLFGPAALAAIDKPGQ